MEGAQVKVGIRNFLVVLLFVVLGIPALKVAVNKVSVPDPIRNWILSI